jgi:hypothetical protein
VISDESLQLIASSRADLKEALAGRAIVRFTPPKGSRAEKASSANGRASHEQCISGREAASRQSRVGAERRVRSHTKRVADHLAREVVPDPSAQTVSNIVGGAFCSRGDGATERGCFASADALPLKGSRFYRRAAAFSSARAPARMLCMA